MSQVYARVKTTNIEQLRVVEKFHEPFTLPLMNASHLAVPLEGSNRLPLYTKYGTLPLLVTACLVALRPSWPIRVGAVLLHVSWTFKAATYSVGGGFEAWLKGSFLGLITLVTFYDMVLADPLVEWRHHSRPEVRLADLSLWKRIYWVLCAGFNSRGLGWSFEVSSESLILSIAIHLGCIDQ